MIFQLSPLYDFTKPCLLLPSGLKLESIARLTLSFDVTNTLSLARATLHLLLTLAFQYLLAGQGTASHGAINRDDVV